MGIDDYIMPPARRIEHGYSIPEYHHSIENSIGPGGAGQLATEPSFYASQRHDSYEPHPGDPETLELAYQPYQAEMPPLARGESFDLPVPVPFEPDSSAVDYDSCRMTQSLFDWSMRNAPDQQTSGADGWVRPEEAMLPTPPLETLVEAFLPDRLDPEFP